MQNIDERDYTPEELKAIKNAIQRIKDQAPIIDINDEHREMKLFSYVYTTLAYMIEYDKLSAEASDTVGYEREMAEDMIRKAGTLHGLITGKSLCSGYSNILQTVLSEFNIESLYVGGGAKTKGEGTGAHAWNQVKLDGQWYNCDLTNDRDFIVSGLKLPFFLKSNKEFNRYEKYPPKIEVHECVSSIKEETQEKLINASRAHVIAKKTEQEFNKEQIEKVKKGPFEFKLFNYLKEKLTKNNKQEKTTNVGR